MAQEGKYPWAEIADIDRPMPKGAKREKPRLSIRRADADSATDIGYTREDGTYAAVRIADDSDAETIAGQLRVLADQIERAPAELRARSTKRWR